MKQSNEIIAALKRGAKSLRCGMYLYNLCDLERQFIYQELEAKRLTLKYKRMMSQHDSEKLDWDQIAFSNLMKYIGNMSNRGNYEEIARRLDINILQRERTSLLNIESLLIGAAGLLPVLPKDNYSKEFVKNGEYMLHKHKIKALRKGEWSRRGVTMATNPIMRLSQMAHIIHKCEHLFAHVANCTGRNDVFNLCNVTASEYLSKYFGNVARNLGTMTCDIVGINAIVPLQYAYGVYSGDDSMLHNANTLNESLPAERNDIIIKWRNWGLTPISAYETQALIELNNNFCAKANCEECIIHKHICSQYSILDKIPLFLEEAD